MLRAFEKSTGPPWAPNTSPPKTARVERPPPLRAHDPGAPPAVHRPEAGTRRTGGGTTHCSAAAVRPGHATADIENRVTAPCSAARQLAPSRFLQDVPIVAAPLADLLPHSPSATVQRVHDPGPASPLNRLRASASMKCGRQAEGRIGRALTSHGRAGHVARWWLSSAGGSRAAGETERARREAVYFCPENRTCRSNRWYRCQRLPSELVEARPPGTPHTRSSPTPGPLTAPPLTGDACRNCPGASPDTRAGRRQPERRRPDGAEGARPCKGSVVMRGRLAACRRAAERTAARPRVERRVRENRSANHPGRPRPCRSPAGWKGP